jgi:hypothetical protein
MHILCHSRDAMFMPDCCLQGGFGKGGYPFVSWHGVCIGNINCRPIFEKPEWIILPSRILELLDLIKYFQSRG